MATEVMSGSQCRTTLCEIVFGPTVMMWLHGILTILSLIMIPVSLLTSLKDSVPYVVFLSLYALFVSHWGAWQGTRAEKAATQT